MAVCLRNCGSLSVYEGTICFDFENKITSFNFSLGEGGGAFLKFDI